jgi:hypothetical protein
MERFLGRSSALLEARSIARTPVLRGERGDGEQQAEQRDGEQVDRAH